MHKKPKIDPSSTYVIDEAEIEQLDELSLTSMVTALVELSPELDVGAAPDAASHQPADDATINYILAANSGEQPPESSPLFAEPEFTGDLLPADVLFPELTPDRR